MSRIHRIALQACLALAPCVAPIAAAAQNADDTTPEAAVRRLFAWNAQRNAANLPSATELAPLRGLLSPALRRAFATARTRDDACTRATPPDDKPDTFEWDWLVGSADDGPAQAQLAIARRTVQGEDARVQVELSATPVAAAPALRWRSELRLHRGSNAWQLVDIDYSDGTHLADVLAAHGRAACASASH